MPKVRVRSLRSLASKCNPSILTGAITESADYIEELEKENASMKKALEEINQMSVYYNEKGRALNPDKIGDIATKALDGKG